VVVAALDPKTWWYTARAAGIVAWALLALSVLWGLALSTKTFGRNPPPAWLLDLHRHLGGLAVVFTGVHLGGLALDNYVHFGVGEIFVPFASSWKPDAVAWGVVGFYVLLAVEVTSLLQRRIRRRWWRRVHMLSFPLYGIATVHLATAGTDRGTEAVQWSAVIVTVAITLLTLIRVSKAVDKRSRRSQPAARVRRAAAADS
jgi:DMSO/TMAO reductase YedYZ heme-binding membrane subunit